MTRPPGPYHRNKHPGPAAVCLRSRPVSRYNFPDMKNRILIVDDAKFMRKLLSKIMQEGGYEVVGEAENGSQAISLYQQLKPDLVTMDLVIPDMSGIDAIKEIIKIDPKARVVVVSAMGQQNLVSEAMRSGARDFVVKPFHPSVVLEVIGRVLKEGN